MQFLHAVQCFNFGTFYNQHWNWYLFCLFLLVPKKKMLLALSLVLTLKQRFNKLINGKNQTNRDQKSSLLFLQQHDQSQTFRIKLVKYR